MKTLTAHIVQGSSLVNSTGELVLWARRHEILKLRMEFSVIYHTVPSFTTSIVELSSAWLFLQKKQLGMYYKCIQYKNKSL